MELYWSTQTCLKVLENPFASSLCVRNLDIKPIELSSSPFKNLPRTCYPQTGASDANASWYRLDDCKVTSLQPTCWKLCGFGSVYVILYTHSVNSLVDVKFYSGGRLRNFARIRSIQRKPEETTIVSLLTKLNELWNWFMLRIPWQLSGYFKHMKLGTKVNKKNHWKHHHPHSRHNEHFSYI